MSIAQDIEQDIARFGRSRSEAEHVVIGNFTMFTDVRAREIAKEINKARGPRIFTMWRRPPEYASLLAELRQVAAKGKEAHAMLSARSGGDVNSDPAAFDHACRLAQLAATLNAADCLRAYCEAMVTGEHLDLRDQYLARYDQNVTLAMKALLRQEGIV